MKVSVEWLREYVEFDASQNELVDSLPMLGLEVEESNSESNTTLENVVVGEVLSADDNEEVAIEVLGGERGEASSGSCN